MQFDTDEEARTLTTITWIRDFWQDDSLRNEVFRKEVSGLAANLRSSLPEIQSKLHPRHQLVLDTKDTLALFLREKNEPATVAVCYVDTSKALTIALRFVGQAVAERTMTLRLDCFGQHTYGWRVADDALSSSQLPNFIVYELVVFAKEVIIAGVSAHRP